LREFGPRIRLACGWRRFRQFAEALRRQLPAPPSAGDIVLYGSGDFHHVSLALLSRISCPINLLVCDLHPDWMRGVPLLHCGTWLWHAARLPQVRRIFHVGGDMDFDNRYAWVAPWREIEAGKFVVIPGLRQFRTRRWKRVDHEPLRESPDRPAGE